MPDNSSGGKTVTDFYPFSNGLDLTFVLPVASVVMLTFNGELVPATTSRSAWSAYSSTISVLQPG